MELSPFLVATFAVWRLSHLLVEEDGPWQLVLRLRRRAGDGFWGELLDCIYCLSLWIALPIALYLGTTWPERLLLWPALSGAALLAHRMTQREDERWPPPAPFHEEEETNHELLR